MGIFVDLILEAITGDDRPYPYLYEKPYKFIRRFRAWERQKYNNTIWQMQRRGLVKIIQKNNQKFILCTSKGQLAILMKKAILPKPKDWDGKWRLVVFDIPEESRKKRNLLRTLLKRNGFYKLQASVFINPYPLNREAIRYLKEAGLKDYIRIMSIHEMDDDEDLLNKFGLK